MKETEYSNGGSVTPEMQAEFLSRYAHLEGIVGNDWYYTYDNVVPFNRIRGKGFKVTVVDGKAVQVTKMTSEEAKTMVACSKLKFGE